MNKLTEVIGSNGVAIPPRTQGSEGYRTYEVHQRERVGQSTEQIKPLQLISAEFVVDPYPLLGILRENYPCYRDWLGNSYWVTRYDDVTSILSDEANFETRSKLWFYGRVGFGRDLQNELAVVEAIATGMDRHASPVAQATIDGFIDGGSTDLATAFAGQFAMGLWAHILDVPTEDLGTFAQRLWTLQRGYHWNPQAEAAGKAAMDELVTYFEPLMSARRGGDGDDLVTAIANVQRADGETTAQDLVATLLEADYETLHGALANLWYLLLTHPEALTAASRDPRMLKLAYLETLRHSTPVTMARRFARHEVERFGRLIPEGALMMCSAAAANRDPRIFDDPDRFIFDRKDICHREARGQYRADGLATGITPGLGLPSKFPAVPEDRPRSLYALTRDTALTASTTLLERLQDICLDPKDANVALRSLRLGEMHTCWKLPVTFNVRS